MSGKTIALTLGIIFILVGIAGFIGGLGIVGPNGIFETNTAHDLVHFVFGLILAGVALWAPAQSGLWLKILGVVYLLIALLGFVTASPLLGFIEANDADAWLHVVLGVVLLAAGFWAKDDMAMGGSMPTPAM
jgi:hypothetical protein